MGPTGPDPSHPSLEAPAWWLGHLPEGHAWSLHPENTGPEVYNLHIPSLGKVICRASALPTLRLPVYFFLSAHRGPAPPSTAATAEAPSCPQGAASSGLRSGLLGRARGQLVTVGLLQPRRPGPPICGASESVLLPWGGGGGRRQSPGHPNISRVRGPRRLLPGVRWSQPSGWSSSVQGFSKRGLDAAVINRREARLASRADAGWRPAPGPPVLGATPGPLVGRGPRTAEPAKAEGESAPGRRARAGRLWPQPRAGMCRPPAQRTPCNAGHLITVPVSPGPAGTCQADTKENTVSAESEHGSGVDLCPEALGDRNESSCSPPSESLCATGHPPHRKPGAPRVRPQGGRGAKAHPSSRGFAAPAQATVIFHATPSRAGPRPGRAPVPDRQKPKAGGTFTPQASDDSCK